MFGDVFDDRLLILLCLLFILQYIGKASSSCVNPNGENGTCVPLESCDVIQKAISKGEEEALRFYYRSRCRDDLSKVCCASSAHFLPEEENDGQLPDGKKCGLSLPPDRILNGELTELLEFPWIALLGYRDLKGSDDAIGFLCGGTLITKRYVLTAAHCLRVKAIGKTLKIVRLGEWRISTDVDCVTRGIFQKCAEPAIDVGVEKQTIHGNYRKRNKKNDIALIRLEKNVKYSPSIKPICLPDSNVLPSDFGKSNVIAGWGYTENSSQSDILMKAKLNAISLKDCVASYKNLIEIGETQICATGNKSADACQGDSGGPLITNVDDRWYLEGVVSVGLGCGADRYPGVYTRVSNYVDWILKNIY